MKVRLRCYESGCVQARIQGVGAGARANPWGGVSPFEMHYSIAFKHQFITVRPPLGEILSVQFSSVHIFRIIPQRGLVSDSITRHSVTPRTNDRYTTHTYLHPYIHTYTG